MLWCGGYLLRFYGKDCETGLAKIVAHLTNSSPSKKRFSNRPIRFPESNLDSGEITGNVIGSARSKDLTAWARGLSPTSTTRSEAPRRWRARRPLESRVFALWFELALSTKRRPHRFRVSWQRTKHLSEGLRSSRPYLQNLDPIGFASADKEQSISPRVFVW